MRKQRGWLLNLLGSTTEEGKVDKRIYLWIPLQFFFCFKILLWFWEFKEWRDKGMASPSPWALSTLWKVICFTPPSQPIFHRNLTSRGDLGQGLQKNMLFPDSMGSPGLNTQGQHRGLKNRGRRCSQTERSWRPPWINTEWSEQRSLTPSSGNKLLHGPGRGADTDRAGCPPGSNKRGEPALETPPP